MGIKKTIVVCGVLSTIVVTSINIAKMKSIDAKIKFDGITIKYDYDKDLIDGSLTYDEIEKYLRIVKFEQEGVEFYRLVSKDMNKFSSRFVPYTIEYIYSDLETGTVLKNYNFLDAEKDKDDKNIKNVVGEKLNIVEEKDLTTYLLQENNIKVKYSARELVDFYNDKVVPTLDKPKVLNK